MSITVKLNYLRIAPRKVRMAVDLIRGKPVDEAATILEFARKKATKPLQKLLKSAVATAENDFQKNRSNLYISKITVNEGPTLKRFRFRGGGRIYEILKRTSHVVLILDEIKPTSKIKKFKKPKQTQKPKKKSKKLRKARKSQKTKTDVQKEKEKSPRPKRKVRLPRPKFKKGVKKIFRRKAF
jgi:large subunit ribosomal protein L22